LQRRVFRVALLPELPGKMRTSSSVGIDNKLSLARSEPFAGATVTRAFR
jgi:hypothetical protein